MIRVDFLFHHAAKHDGYFATHWSDYLQRSRDRDRVDADFMAIATYCETIIRPVLLDLGRAKPWSSKDERISTVIGQVQQHHCGELECFTAY